MGFKKIKPSLELSPYVNYFWILDIQQKDLPFVHTILPYPWFELFFNLDNTSSVEGKYIGQLSAKIKIIYKEPYRAVGVRMKPSAGNALFHKPANEFSNCSINWSDLDAKSSLHKQLKEAKLENKLILLFENYITEKLKNYEIDKVSAYISQQVVSQPYLGINDSILSSIGLSRRRIEQRFLASTGVSMGLFVRKTRFDCAMDYLSQDNSSSLTHVGLDLGYYDQAHFSREFKEFSGISPKTYRKELLKMTELERLLL